MDIKSVQAELMRFAEDRDWDQFHSPKNLSMALAGEAGELLELYQWQQNVSAQSVKNDAQLMSATRHELADILIYLLRLADKLEIDLEDAVRDKMKLNEERYPVELSRGRALKYDKLVE